MFSMIQSMPYAGAKISGNSMYPKIKGDVSFYEVYGGTLVVATVKNLPDAKHDDSENCRGPKNTLPPH